MSTKSAAFFALIGTLLLTLLALWDFVTVASGVANQVVAPVVIFRALIYLIGSLSVTLFFWVFYNHQST